jgi:phosphatidylserine/phosphatidylglycerophosphate/cardiolipin synthase-like enzyme
MLQSIFGAELLSPSRCLWIVSPWLRDVPVLDNSTGAFGTLCPEFPLADVRLSHVLRELILRGTTLVIATRPDEGNRQVIDAISNDPRAVVTFLERPLLHMKGIVGDRYALVGSMNLTYNGVERLTEMIVFETQPAQVESLRIAFKKEYGGVI